MPNAKDARRARGITNRTKDVRYEIHYRFVFVLTRIAKECVSLLSRAFQRSVIVINTAVRIHDAIQPTANAIVELVTAVKNATYALLAITVFLSVDRARVI